MLFEAVMVIPPAPARKLPPAGTIITIQSAPDTMLTERPYWPYPRVIAHRGGGLLAPENTLAALRYARNLG